MYKTIVVFMVGYITHKHIVPFLDEVARKVAFKIKEGK